MFLYLDSDRLTTLTLLDLGGLKHNFFFVILLIALETDLEEDTVPLPTVNNWTILMHRFDGSLNFNRSWVEYRNGFGDIGSGEFWLGNEKIHRLTSRIGVVRTLRIEVFKNAVYQ